jgi:hypothetical protein
MVNLTAKICPKMMSQNDGYFLIYHEAIYQTIVHYTISKFDHFLLKYFINRWVEINFTHTNFKNNILSINVIINLLPIPFFKIFINTKFIRVALKMILKNQ